jgi:betaine-aldehyde dehydrogenase
LEEFKMWIGGKWMDAASGEKIDVVNPATEEVVATIPNGGRKDVDLAVEAAKKAFPEWSRKPQSERIAVAYRIAEELRKDAGELGRLDTIDHGSPARMSGFMSLGAAGQFEYAAQVSRGLMNDQIPQISGKVVYLKREPIGVAALIIPWNLPLMMAVWKLASALVVGNTSIIKPSVIDALTIVKMGEALERAGVPEGVVNIITGPGDSVGEMLAVHPGIDLISFTGSAETGKRIMELAGGTLKRLCMELGGKNPFIVMEDAKVDEIVPRAAMIQYMNGGMLCASPGRFYIHESLYDDFVKKFVEFSKNVVAGDPYGENTTMGPMVSAGHREKVESYIESGIKEGATLLLDGRKPHEKGYYVGPTVFGDVGQEMKIARDEIFGPVASMFRFSTEEEVVEKANDNAYGLCCSIWTKDVARGVRMANRIQAGTVWVNDHGSLPAEMPWGGFKNSGFGKECSVIGLDSYTQIKSVSIDLGEMRMMGPPPGGGRPGGPGGPPPGPRPRG